MDYFDWNNFGTNQAGQQYVNNPAWTSGEMTNPNVQQVNQAVQMFQQKFQQQMGRPPNPDELAGFVQGPLYSAWVAPGDLGYNDYQNLANNYISQQGFKPPVAPPSPTPAPTAPPQTGGPLGQAGSQGAQPLPPLPPSLNLPDPNAPPPTANPTPLSDISGFINPIMQQQQDITKQGIAKSQGVASSDLSQLNNLISPWIMQQFIQYTDPTNPANQQMMGELNNAGVASGGAFPQALASRLAPLISTGMLDLGQSALTPSFATQQGLIGKGTEGQTALSLAPLQRYMQQKDFSQQSNLAQQLAAMGQPYNPPSSIPGMASGAAQGAGALATGAAALSWICGHLKKLELATEKEVEAVHEKLRPSFFRHTFEWVHYFLYAPRLIELCDLAGIPWDEVKKNLIDEVLGESDPEQAWQIYRAECQRLCLRYAPHLWSLEVIYAA